MGVQKGQGVGIRAYICWPGAGGVVVEELGVVVGKAGCCCDVSGLFCGCRTLLVCHANSWSPLFDKTVFCMRLCLLRRLLRSLLYHGGMIYPGG